ncbi:MAG: hypothetical protein ACRDSR_05700 [Pseudonocardiaceae bacterium]
MPTHIKDDPRVTNVRDDLYTYPVLDVADPTAEADRAAADTTVQWEPDSMVQLVRQGLNTSLKSVQVWADLARQVGPDVLRSPAGATMAARAHDPLALLLAAQRAVVSELAATQRQLTQQVFHANVGDGRAF